MLTTYSLLRMPNWLKTLALVACISVCILAVLLVAVFPRPFVLGHYCSVHRPVHRIVSQSDWRGAVVAWSDVEFSKLLFPTVNRPLRSTDLRTLTCTLNC